MVDREFNKTLLLGLLREAGTGSSKCADCGAPDPEWASYKLGVFICLNCSGIHRKLPEISRVKSIHLDFWENDLLEFMKTHGNLWAKAKYEAKVPPFYYIPHSEDCLTILAPKSLQSKDQSLFCRESVELCHLHLKPEDSSYKALLTNKVLKEQWIRAKYEWEEFVATSVCHETGSSGSHEGFLWKRGRDSRQFLERRFLLSAREGVLKYYTKESKGPKAGISIKDLNAMFQTEKIRNPHGLQITYSKEGQTRNLLVYHESGEEIVDWFNAIRAARFHYLRTAFPTAPEAELIPKITRNYFKEGYMEKTGPKHNEAFKTRWFSLDSQERNLLYFKDPLDAFELGRVFIGSKEQGYEVQAGLPRGVREKRWKAGLTIVTPHRKFVFVCENDREQKEWIAGVAKRDCAPAEPHWGPCNYLRQL